ESIVGLLFERSVAMAVGLLGILKAGAAYLPLDPSQPNERLDFIFQDARVKVVLTERRLLERLSDQRATIVALDSDDERISLENSACPAVRTTPENLVYVIYTS